MCDAIAVVCHGGRLYVRIVEQKTEHKDEHWRQIANGRLFAQWLLDIYSAQGYEVGEYTVFGVLAWQPRRSPNKGTSTYVDLKGQRDVNDFDWYFEFRNERRIYVPDIIARIERDDLGKRSRRIARG